MSDGDGDIDGVAGRELVFGADIIKLYFFVAEAPQK
jgi:hypothetical protein